MTSNHRRRLGSNSTNRSRGARYSSASRCSQPSALGQHSVTKTANVNYAISPTAPSRWNTESRPSNSRLNNKAKMLERPPSRIALNSMPSPPPSLQFVNSSPLKAHAVDRLVSIILVVVWLGGCQATAQAPASTPAPLEPLPRAVVRKHTPSPTSPIQLVPPSATPSPHLRDELNRVQSEVDALHSQIKDASQ